MKYFVVLIHNWILATIHKLKFSKKPCQFHVVLVEPQIPGNTGSAGRLCVATNTILHLVKPLGFQITDTHLRRAGLDYWKYIQLHVHENFEQCLFWFQQNESNTKLYVIENGTHVTQNFYNLNIPRQAGFIFGKESDGLRQDLVKNLQKQAYSIPMFSKQVRSLNLASCAHITIYEALRQNPQ